MSELAVRWIFVLDADYLYDLRRHLPSNWSDGCAFVATQRPRLSLHRIARPRGWRRKQEPPWNP